MELGQALFNTKHPIFDTSTESGEYELEFQNATVVFNADIELTTDKGDYHTPDHHELNYSIEIEQIFLNDDDSTEVEKWDENVIVNELEKYL